MRTYQATIYCGLMRQYPHRIYTIAEVMAICQEYTHVMGLGVTVTATNFVYGKGVEPGVMIGFANCPGSKDIDVKNPAVELAKILKKLFSQNHVIVVCTDETFKV